MKRLLILKAAPAAYEAMMGLESYLQNAGIKPEHYDLIKIRASQINHCAYCIDKHTRDARERGEREQRIYLLDAWRETDLFTDEEQAILALTEEITLIHKGGVSEATYTKAEQLFGESYLAQLLMAVVTINAWNRIGVTADMGRLIEKK
ncbi:carboxymuconolactone decarboxylase family protein [Compostibacter hankyongensis]|uniref:Carboxymuconolactone decarboxylase family protein n=1 Tax=Compostibacter hankyongensis TaxID=1007089 RepID=A0ABP8G6K6_9BACT